jgi:YjbE family integral membrane protein
MIEWLSSPTFWIAVAQIIMIDILLGGDNAVVIALACRNLPEAQRRLGILWGTFGAILLRVILIFFAVTLLQFPYLRLVGGALLIWIGVKLLVPEGDGEHGDLQGGSTLMSAIKTIIVADFVMSLDNVIAIAGAAQRTEGGQQMFLVIFGLLVSIPIIVWGSTIVLKLIDRYPIVVTVGGGLLGYIAGDLMVKDPAILAWTESFAASLGISMGNLGRIAGLVCAVGVVLAGKMIAARKPRAAAEA